MHWDTEKIEALSAKKLISLLDNCYREIKAESTRAIEAQQILEIIHTTDRLKEGAQKPVGLPESDPKVQEMKALLEGDEAKALMVKAAKEGLPSIVYVDPILQKELGEWYGTRYHSTATAGGYVGEIMRDLGYELEGRGNLPSSCKAKTAAIFSKPSKIKS